MEPIAEAPSKFIVASGGFEPPVQGHEPCVLDHLH